MTAGMPVIQRLGPYLLHGLIGAGAMGEVHRAVDTAHDGRLVALKLLPPEVAQDPQRRARFEHESHIVAALTEPHVIDVHRYGDIDGRLFIDMQLVDGPDLGTYLAGTGPLRPDHAVAVTEQVAAALDAAHAAGLVHHDVKPSNVLLHRPSPDRAPRAVLADFGIAGDAGGFGTVEYLAPERWNGLPGDSRVDVYALACVLHELLTGTRAFPGGEFAAQLHGHLRLPPPRPSALVPWLPAALDAVVAAGMAKDPALRVPAAGQLAAMARAALAPPRRGPSRRRLLVGATAGLVTLGGGVAVATAVRSTARPGGGPPPERITADRALGIRSTVSKPFALGTVGGSALAVVIDRETKPVTVQAWDILTDKAVGPARPGGLGGIAYLSSQLAIADVGGRGLLCSAVGSAATQLQDGSVSVADLMTGKGIGNVRTPAAQCMAATDVDGTPILFVLDGKGVLSRFDLGTRAPAGPALPVPGSEFLGELAVADVGGTSCVLVGAYAGRPLTAFDASSFEQVAEWPWSARAVVTVDGDPVGLTAADALLISAPGEQPRRVEAPGSVAVVAAEVGGRGVAAVGLESGAIALYDVPSGSRLNAVLTGHQAQITQLGIVRSGQRPLLISAAADNTIRVWDLAVHAHG